MDDWLNISQERLSHSLTVLIVRGVFLTLWKEAVIISVIFCLPSSHAFFLWKKNYSCPTLSPPGSNGTDHPGYEVKHITQVCGHRCTLLPWPEWFIEGWHRTQVSLMSMSPESQSER